MELDDIQKEILIGCLKYEKSIFIPALSRQGITSLCLDNLSDDGEEEYKQIQNHWVADLIGTYLIKAGNDTYKFTEEGLKVAQKLRDEAQTVGA